MPGSGGGWTTFGTERPSCTLVQGMASSAFMAALLLSGTNFAVKKLSCVRQKSCSVEHHKANCSSVFSVAVGFSVQDTLKRFMKCTFCLTLDSDFAKENLVILLRCFSPCHFPCLVSSPFLSCHHLLCLETKLVLSRFELVLFFLFFCLSFFDGFEQGVVTLGL